VKNDFQREVVDALASNKNIIGEYRIIYSEWKRIQQELDDLKDQKNQFDKEADYNRFQFAELDEAGFRENELEETDAELKMLSNSEGIKSALSKVYFELKESESPLVNQLKVLSNQLQGYASFHPQLPELIKRLQSAQLELQDVAGDLNSISDHINFSPEKIEQLNDRLSLGYKLMKKHGVKTTNELLAIQSQLQEKLQAVLNIDDSIQQKEKQLSTTNRKALELANQISEEEKNRSSHLKRK
jgi:DNA repair protein RecN (Recombination protein N)